MERRDNGMKFWPGPRIYLWDGSVWNQLGSDIEGEAVQYDKSGWSVSLSADGQTVAIGAHYNMNGFVRDIIGEEPARARTHLFVVRLCMEQA